jgi:hypothetical protein
MGVGCRATPLRPGTDGEQPRNGSSTVGNATVRGTVQSTTVGAARDERASSEWARPQWGASTLKGSRRARLGDGAARWRVHGADNHSGTVQSNAGALQRTQHPSRAFMKKLLRPPMQSTGTVCTLDFQAASCLLSAAGAAEPPCSTAPSCKCLPHDVSILDLSARRKAQHSIGSCLLSPHVTFHFLLLHSQA